MADLAKQYRQLFWTGMLCITILGGMLWYHTYEDSQRSLCTTHTVEQIIKDSRPKMGPMERKFLMDVIQFYALKHNVPQDFLAAKLAQESNFKSYVRGARGEVGIAQLMPMHWKGKFDPLEIELSVDKGAELFATELKFTKGDVFRALQRYNGNEKLEQTKVYANAIHTRVLIAERKVCRR